MFCFKTSGFLTFSRGTEMKHWTKRLKWANEAFLKSIYFKTLYVKIFSLVC